MEISEELVNVLDNIIEPSGTLMCGIVGYINLDNTFRLIFKDHIKLKKVEDTYTDLLDVVIDEIIDITKTPIKMPKDIDEYSYCSLFISRNSLYDDVIEDSYTNNDIIIFTNNPLDEINSVCGYKILTTNSQFVIQPKEFTIEGIKDLMIFMKKMQKEGRLSDLVEIKFIDLDYD